MIGRLGIRARIVGGSVLIAALISIIAGVLLDAQIGRIVRDGTMAVLRSDTASYQGAIQAGHDLDRPGSGQLIAVVTPGGTTKVSSLPSALAAALPHDLSEEGGDAETHTVIAGGRAYIVRSMPVTSAAGVWHVVAARTTESEDTVLGQMRVLLTGMLVAIVVGVGVAAWLLTSLSLSPVRRLRRTAELLSSEDSRELLPVGTARDDIAALATTLNGLIDRLRDSAERERQLVSDASHELRTPLAILRAQLDVARADPRSLDRLLADLGEVDRSAERLSHLLESLLELSRLESDERATSITVAALREELAAAVDRTEFRLPEASPIVVRLEAEIPPDAGERRVAVSADEAGRIVDNLVGNAIAAAGEGAATIVVRCAARDADVVVAVADDTGGMPDELLDHAFERFRRGESARSSGRGAGLGLAIVAAIARRAGGTAELRNEAGVGLTVEVTLPFEETAGA
jgi:signal transduction histidine kinase